MNTASFTKSPPRRRGPLTSASSSSFACAVVLFVGLGLPCEAHAQATFISKGSGVWDDPTTWQLTSGTDEDGIPDDDDVQIRGGHRVEIQPGSGAGVRVLNLYGELAMQGDTPSSLRLLSVFVRGSGHLLVEGPHTLTFEGGPLPAGQRPSFLETRGAGRTTLRGALLVEEGRAGAVLAETAHTLEVASEGLEPGTLVGARWKFTSGRARLRTFEVVEHTADRVRLHVVERSGPRLDAFEADATPDGMRLLAPPDTVRVVPREHADQVWDGRWVRSSNGALRVVLGAHDGGTEPDTIVVWPPATGHTTFAHTWAVTPGDRFTVDRPVRLTVPPEVRPDLALPAYTYGLTFAAGSRTDLDRVAIDYGNVAVRGVDGTEEGGYASLRWVDLRQVHASCQFESRRTVGLVLDHLVVADVHPDSEDIEYGGFLQTTTQWGHGLCLYGQDLTVRDTLVIGTNDDAIYAGGVEGMTLSGNIVAGVGIFHGNSYEALAMATIGPNVTIDGNALFGGSRTLWTQGRTVGSSLDVRNNLLAQPDPYPLVLDAGPVGGTLLVENNLLLSVGGSIESSPGSGAVLAHNVVVGAQVDGVDVVRDNLLLPSNTCGETEAKSSMVDEGLLDPDALPSRLGPLVRAVVDGSWACDTTLTPDEEPGGHSADVASAHFDAHTSAPPGCQTTLHTVQPTKMWLAFATCLSLLTRRLRRRAPGPPLAQHAGAKAQPVE